MRKPIYYRTVVLLALAVGALAVTNQSLWIDEGSAAVKALEPSLGDWWRALRQEKDSNLQLLGQLFFLWGWAKIFGATEVALRASNIPFFSGGIVALIWGSAPDRRRQGAIGLLCLTNAFLWYYVSEARPYIFLFAFAALTCASLLRLLTGAEASPVSRAWFGFFGLGLVGLCLTSLIAVPWALGAMAAAVYWLGPREAVAAILRNKAVSLLAALSLGALAVYYLWTLQLGAPPSAVGRTRLINVGFILYEQLGLAGLGPGRLLLRVHGATGTAPFLPWIGLGIGAVFVLFLQGLFALKPRLTKRQAIFFLLAVALPFALVFAAGAAGRVRLLGRHLTPLLPYLLAWMSVALASLSLGAWWKKMAAGAVLTVLLISSLEMRFAPRHERDDYRSAAAVAIKAIASGERVWWLADRSTARYYRVPLAAAGMITSGAPLQPNEKPDLVILSKPDVYDPAGSARAYLAQNGFTVTRRLPAFEIFQRPPKTPESSKSPGKSGE